ncbi:hypothetical protein PWG71_26615 [Nocardiopsis sp. N85]|uniref:hypothetical protein n=1 Tax=Nocardiopsis sp. N85 TaxID=3029400 RepID=UPI00237F1BAC|nr:hypothetical protein [Nocardiopsis sp. N85]MDE3724974.1 hypothetical protein [Nocardiopsis sp. N85]
MNRKTFTRIAFAAVIAPTLAFGAPAVAMADSYFSGKATVAGPYGAASHSVTAIAKDGHGKHGHGKGGSYFDYSSTFAGPKGAASNSSTSAAH